jgi:hypothetical protein
MSFEEMLLSMVISQLALISREQNNKFVNADKIIKLTEGLFNLIATIVKLQEMDAIDINKEYIQLVLQRANLLNTLSK